VPRRTGGGGLERVNAYGIACVVERVIRDRAPHEGPEAWDVVAKPTVGDHQPNRLGRFGDQGHSGRAAHERLGLLKGDTGVRSVRRR